MDAPSAAWPLTRSPRLAASRRLIISHSSSSCRRSKSTLHTPCLAPRTAAGGYCPRVNRVSEAAQRRRQLEAEGNKADQRSCCYPRPSQSCPSAETRVFAVLCACCAVRLLCACRVLAMSWLCSQLPGMLGTACAWGLGAAPAAGPWLSAVQTGNSIAPVLRGREGTIIILLGTCPEKENSEMPKGMSQLKQEASRTPLPSFVVFLK